jgi:hypothetical protein
MRQVESLTELYFATAKAIPSLFAIAESMQVAFFEKKPPVFVHSAANQTLVQPIRWLEIAGADPLAVGAHEKFSFEANSGRSRVCMVIAMKMIRAKRSIVLVRRWLIRARQHLELVPAVYWLIRLVIEFYAAKALRGIRAQELPPRDN